MNTLTPRQCVEILGQFYQMATAQISGADHLKVQAAIGRLNDFVAEQEKPAEPKPEPAGTHD